MTLRKKLLFSAVSCGLFLLVVVGVLELAAWALGYPAAPVKYQKTLWLPDAELGWVCRPNGDFHYLGPGGWLKGTTDRDGYRPTLTNGQDPSAAVVLCLGDSTTFSAECRDSETWPEAAAGALAGGGPEGHSGDAAGSRDTGKKVAFVNRGVGGYGGVQSLLTLRKAFRDPALAGRTRAVVYHFAFNDPGDNFYCDKDMPRPILVSRKEGVASATRATATTTAAAGPNAAETKAAGTGAAGLAFEVQPGRMWEVPSSSPASWLRSHLHCYSMFRSWTRRTSPGAFGEAVRDMKEHLSDPCRRFIDDPQWKGGVQFTIAEMKKECDAHGVRLLVSLANIPFFDNNPLARSEAATVLGLPPDQAEQQAKVYDDACGVLAEIVRSCGGEFIDTRNVLRDLPCHQWAANCNDAHLSAAANQKMGAHIAKAVLRYFASDRT